MDDAQSLLNQASRRRAGRRFSGEKRRAILLLNIDKPPEAKPQGEFFAEIVMFSLNTGFSYTLTKKGVGEW